ncbi:MAG: thermonuclease family protein [Caldimicrobium sp.]|nr:thermonuclease family protein [Caldimicrobium sp.]MCX7874365.1 thermonuclease family protein [Caldimicrobium sp.]MDW8093491.1 thermonuclease family protein [Caldimicrobium sp.]
MSRKSIPTPSFVIFGLYLFIFAAILIGCRGFGSFKDREAISEEPLHCEAPLIKVKVKKVLDGDTLLLENGERVRYAGINTMELQGKGGQPEPFAVEAYLRNKELAEGKTFCLKVASRKRDSYGRLLGDLYFANGTSLSEILVSEGLALVCYYEGSAEFWERLLPLQVKAIEARRGLFAFVDKPEAKSVLIGNKQSKRFHDPACYDTKKIKRKIIFQNLEQALREGYCPSRECIEKIFSSEN